MEFLVNYNEKPNPRYVSAQKKKYGKKDGVNKIYDFVSTIKKYDKGVQYDFKLVDFCHDDVGILCFIYFLECGFLRRLKRLGIYSSLFY